MNPVRGPRICAGLALADYQVAAVLALQNLTAEVEKLSRRHSVDANSPSRDTLENLAAMHRTCRAGRLFTRRRSGDDPRTPSGRAFRPMSSVASIPGASSHRRVARARFEDTQALRRELDEISQKLSDRKLVDKARAC